MDRTYSTCTQTLPSGPTTAVPATGALEVVDRPAASRVGGTEAAPVLPVCPSPGALDGVDGAVSRAGRWKFGCSPPCFVYFAPDARPGEVVSAARCTAAPFALLSFTSSSSPSSPSLPSMLRLVCGCSARRTPTLGWSGEPRDATFEWSALFGTLSMLAPLLLPRRGRGGAESPWPVSACFDGGLVLEELRPN